MTLKGRMTELPIVRLDGRPAYVSTYAVAPREHPVGTDERATRQPSRLPGVRLRRQGAGRDVVIVSRVRPGRTCPCGPGQAWPDLHGRASHKCHNIPGFSHTGSSTGGAGRARAERSAAHPVLPAHPLPPPGHAAPSSGSTVPPGHRRTRRATSPGLRGRLHRRADPPTHRPSPRRRLRPAPPRSPTVVGGVPGVPSGPGPSTSPSSVVANATCQHARNTRLGPDPGTTASGTGCGIHPTSCRERAALTRRRLPWTGALRSETRHPRSPSLHGVEDVDDGIAHLRRSSRAQDERVGGTRPREERDQGRHPLGYSSGREGPGEDHQVECLPVAESVPRAAACQLTRSGPCGLHHKHLRLLRPGRTTHPAGGGAVACCASPDRSPANGCATVGAQQQFPKRRSRTPAPRPPSSVRTCMPRQTVRRSKPAPDAEALQLDPAPCRCGIPRRLHERRHGDLSPSAFRHRRSRRHCQAPLSGETRCFSPRTSPAVPVGPSPSWRGTRA